MKVPSTKPDRQAFVMSQPEAIREVFEAFFRKSPRHSLGHEDRAKRWLNLPYWRILPAALRARFRSRKPLSSAILRDIQWAQYCLFLFIRFQDDVFDGQSHNPASIYAADQCLFEADRIFAKHFSFDSWFWKIYRESLMTSTRSIVEVDMLQKKSTSRPADLLEGYARVCSIFKVGSAAMCAMLDQKKAFMSISVLCDEMAKAGQIIDDMRDMEEDLKRNRYNYVASALHRSEKRKPRQRRSKALLEELRMLAATEQIYDEVRTHVQNASKAVAPLGMSDMVEYLGHYTSLITAL